MPQPISVAIVCSSCDLLNRLRKKVKVSEPGMAPRYYLVALDQPGKRIITPDSIPSAKIDLWLALDQPSLELAKRTHEEDKQKSQYERGFYDELLPECVVQIDASEFNPKRIKELESWIDRVQLAFYHSS